MRRKEREVTDIRQQLNILKRCKVCRLAMQDAQGLYIVPMNFGYEYQDGKLTLYFHGAREGRKIQTLENSPTVAFEMDCEGELLEGENPCAYGYAYKSLMGTGKAVLVSKTEEKKKALSLLMRHQTGMEFCFTDQQTESVAVIRVEAKEMTAKCREQPNGFAQL